MYFIILLPLLFFMYVSNNYLSVSVHTLPRRGHKKSASSLSIVQISDLHNKSFGSRQSYLMKKIASLHPDLIAVTGDLVDGAPFAHAAEFLKRASEICPVYVVRGNHESMAGNFAAFEKKMKGCHVYLLKNTFADFKKDGYTYRITGLDDPKFRGKDKNYTLLMKETLDKIVRRQKEGGADYQILLSHRPELFLLYSSYPFDLVLCGHAHGGQFRPPFTDGLYAPNQGIFPKYTSGAHKNNHTTEIISRGLGNSSFPLRLFNFPEIVKIVIK
ncbi:MAG: metallophosphoesterase [Eubacterium sp.]|nr:metallophosphoesterase [Eubacterium sp.]